jgi:hypothetical protein
MHELGLIGAQTRNAAVHVKEFGNDMAHGDFVLPVTNTRPSWSCGCRLARS